ncbi:hypothetical protein B0H13DRAFT_2363643 [Mycena leptocephala]|nr:hypothetical protein B0H13DRAFT_2363643 [Mycena leptocephala]
MSRRHQNCILSGDPIYLEFTRHKAVHNTSTDHAGPFLFTKLLAPKLLAAATPAFTPRVVFVSSAYISSNAYFQAKSANILTSIELSKRSKGKINAYKGGLDSRVAGDGRATPRRKTNLELGEWTTIPQGAATLSNCLQALLELIESEFSTVTAASDPRLKDKPGAYLDNSVVANDKVAPHSSDTANAEKLWDITEKMIGETFAF